MRGVARKTTNLIYCVLEWQWMIDYGVLARVEVTHNAKSIIKSWISTNVFSVAYIIEYMIFLISLKLIRNICVKQTQLHENIYIFCERCRR